MNDDGPRYRRSPAGAVALTALAVGLGGWGIVNSPMFDTRRIEVRGAHHLSSNEVVAAAGVRTGQNLVRVATDRVALSVEGLSWVADAVARRDLPSTLVIHVVERTPTAWLVDPEGFAVVARDGTVLERPSHPPRRDLPVVGEISAVVAPGRVVPAVPPQLRVVASMDRRLREHVSAAVSADGDVGLELRTGGTVHYGSATSLGDKNRALVEMIEWAAQGGIEVGSIDLRIPQAPTLHPEDPEAPLGRRRTGR